MATTTTTCATCREAFISFDAADRHCLHCLEGQAGTVPSLIEDVRICGERSYLNGQTEWGAAILLSDADLARLIGEARTASAAIANVWQRFVLHVQTQDHDVLAEERALWHLAQM